VFLPMHIPVLLAGFLVGPGTGLLVGLTTPLISSILTSMPPMMPPIAPVMVFELGTYGLVAGLLYRRTGNNILVSLLAAMVAGRIVSGIGTALALPLVGLDAVPVWAPFTVGLMTSWPGVLIQIVFVPLIVKAAEQTTVFDKSRVHGDIQ